MWSYLSDLECTGCGERWPAGEQHGLCPTCGKVLKLHVQVCNRCGTDLDFPELAIEPESAAYGR